MLNPKMQVTIKKANCFSGSPVLLGDKSLSHRSLILGALAKGKTEIIDLSPGEDVRSTCRCLQALGVEIKSDKNKTTVNGVGLHGLRASSNALDCGNSGTTMRMLMGVLCAQSFDSVLVGDKSLSSRPMDRVAKPLAAMGASMSLKEGIYAPIKITGMRKLASVDLDLKIASAQIKTAILLAGLYTEGKTTITGKIKSRDHTERLLAHFGVPVLLDNNCLTIRGNQILKGVNCKIPGDPSSAAYWLAAVCIAQQGTIKIENVLLNSTRTGFFKVMVRMGAAINEKVHYQSPEPVGDLSAQSSLLQGTKVTKEEVPFLIDEIPLLAVLGVYANGITEVRGAQELRIKETDRIKVVADNLQKMGAKIETFQDGFRIAGPQKLRGTKVDSCGDHRMAMAFAIAALGAEGETQIENAQAIGISYPNFFSTLENLVHE